MGALLSFNYVSIKLVMSNESRSVDGNKPLRAVKQTILCSYISSHTFEQHALLSVYTHHCASNIWPESKPILMSAQYFRSVKFRTGRSILARKRKNTPRFRNAWASNSAFVLVFSWFCSCIISAYLSLRLRWLWDNYVRHKLLDDFVRSYCEL
jgi:hypothetical protein